MVKKLCNEYYLSVEGETEKWYFEHLQKLINENEDLIRKVKFNITINKSIISSAKGMSVLYETNAFHICDYESNEDVHQKQFENTLIELNNVRKMKKNIKYKLGYSNFSFDLWIILHKMQQLSPVTNRKQYVNGINKAYAENFEFINDYKEEKNFKRILSNITLNDIIIAVNNAKKIRSYNEENRKDSCKVFGKFEYFTENPDLTINECVEQILVKCGAML